MFTTQRRRAENHRVRMFLMAIRESGLDLPAAEQWPADRTDTVQFPRIVLTAAVPLMVLALSACSSPAPVSPEPASVVQTLAPAAETPQQPEQLTGTDAGLVGPAPTVAELDQLEHAAAGVPAPTIPHVTESAPAPVQPDPAPQPQAVARAPQDVQEQLPEESTGRQIDCADGTVGTVAADGTVDCGQ